MKRELVVAVGLVLIASTVTAVVGHANPAGPVYTVAQVQSGLYRNPQAWADSPRPRTNGDVGWGWDAAAPLKPPVAL